MEQVESQPSNPFYEFVQSYSRNRVGFVRNILKVEPMDWQAEEMRALDAGNLRLSIRSGHGVGKSAFLAWVMIHYLMTRWPVKIVATAPSAPQLFDALGAEIKRWVQELPEPLREVIEVTSDRVFLKDSPESAFLSLRTSRAETPEALQGVHALYTLLIADEASGVPESIFESASGSMSTPGAITILTGNPTRTGNFFWKTQTEWADKWRVRKVSCFDSETVDPEFIREMQERYGIDSNQFRVRVLGEFPTADDDTFIPRELVEGAVDRDITPDNITVWGLDVARYGAAASALAKRQGNVLLEIKRWRQLDLMQLVGAVKVEWEATPEELRPTEIFVDAIGLGAGVTDRLRELKLPAVAVNVSDTPSTLGQYMRLRDELWGKMRLWFESRKVSIPHDKGLIEELCMPKLLFTSSGKLQLESKDSMVRRGFVSPDAADALAMTYTAEGAAALGMTHTSWNSNINDGLDVNWFV
jgi:hypothetical protein